MGELDGKWNIGKVPKKEEETCVQASGSETRTIVKKEERRAKGGKEKEQRKVKERKKGEGKTRERRKERKKEREK